MLVGAKVCELTDGFLWFVCGLYVGTLTSHSGSHKLSHLRLSSSVVCLWSQKGNFDVSPYYIQVIENGKTEKMSSHFDFRNIFS